MPLPLAPAPFPRPPCPAARGFVLPGRIPSMKKLLILLGLAAAAFLGLFLWVRSWLTPEYIRAQIETQAANHYKGQVTLGSVALEFPLSVGVHDLKVADPTGKTVYLDLGSASASLEPWALFDQKVHITAFTIEKPLVLLALDAQGQLEMLEHLIPSETSDSSSAAPALAVSSLRLHGAAVTLRRPGAADMVVKPIDAHLALLGETLTLHSLTVKALDTLALEATGTLTGLLSAPKAEGVIAKLTGSMPPGFLDPKTAGQILGTVDVEAKIDGPLSPEALGGTFVAQSSGLTWKAPDDALAPVKVDGIHAEGKIRKMGLDLTKATVDIWQGALTLAGRVDASHSKLTGRLEEVTVGQWLGPMLTARGFGPPLETLRVNSGLVLALDRLALKELSATAGGLRVEGNTELLAQGADWRFAPGSQLAGTFAGADLASAMALPDIELEGDLGVDMKLAGAALAPKIDGAVKAPKMAIRRPKTFSIPVTDLAGTFHFEDSKLDVPSLTAKVLGGNLKSSAGAVLNAVPPSYRFRLDAVSLQVPEIFSSVLVHSPFATGALDIDFEMKGAGSDPKALTGEGKAAIRTARLAPNPTLDLLASQLKEPKIKEAELDGKFKIIEVSDGRIRLGDFAGTNGKLGPLSGEGSVGFDQTLAGTAKLEVPLDSPQLPKVLQGKKLPLSVTLGGSLTEPKVQMGDIGKALGKMAEDEAKRKLEAKAQEKLGGALDKLLGGSKAPADGAPTDASAPPPANAKDAIKQKAGNLLKGLFR